jgi:PiT family inorganic phosphate transporter
MLSLTKFLTNYTASGVGSAIRVSAVRWGVTFRVVSAWVLTIPASAILAGMIYSLYRVGGLK